mgnify:CR=1 FL=1
MDQGSGLSSKGSGSCPAGDCRQAATKATFASDGPYGASTMNSGRDRFAMECTRVPDRPGQRLPRPSLSPMMC